MKKYLLIPVSILLMLSLVGTALASEFDLDPYARFGDMEISWYQGYDPVIKNNTMYLHLPLRAESCVGDITVELALEDPHVLLLAAEPKPVTVAPKDGIYPVKLTLPLAKNRRNGDYPAVITVTGKDGKGRQIEETIPYIIRIRDSRGSHESLDPVISLIRSQLNVGSEGVLELALSNPTTTLSATEGFLTVTDPSGDIRLTATDRVEIPEILPGKTVTVSLPVTVKGNAEVALHDLEITFSCICLDRETQWTRILPVPVTQEIRLEQGGVQMPSTFPGELTTMTLPLMNLGKAGLQNVLVKLEMDGVLDPQSVLVGTLSPGETKQAKLTFTPETGSVGVHSGTVTITCEDAYGNPFLRTLCVGLTVEEPLPERDTKQEEEKEKMPVGTVALIALCVALTVGLVIQGTILTKKIHKLEEERL